MLNITKKAMPFLVLLILSIGCGQSIPDEMIYYGPDRKADIVFYFKKGTTNDQVNEFLETQLATPHSSGKGHWPLPGIQGDFRVITQEYEGYAVSLKKGITQEEYEKILGVVKSSPLIYKVFEHVVPNEIVLDPAIEKKEKEELEKSKNDNRPTKKMVVTNNSTTR